MKTILVPTDFSPPAENAARYAMHLAIAIGANIKLCHAYKIPSETGYNNQGSWLLYNEITMEGECTKKLALLAGKLIREEWGAGAARVSGLDVSYTAAEGSAFTVLMELAKEDHVLFTVMGMNGFGAIESFLIGSTSRQMIGVTESPLFLVPCGSVFKGIKKIAFATDLNKKDIAVIHALVGFASKFNADLLITHVSSSGISSAREEERVESFLNEVTCKINYDKIYYRPMRHPTVGQGLDWLAEFGFVDLQVMIHRRHSLLERLVKGSFTKAQAAKTKVPLLVMPEGVHPVF